MAEMKAMALALDRETRRFLQFSRSSDGIGHVWIAFFCRSRISALPDVAKKLRLPAANLDFGRFEAQVNNALTGKFSPSHSATYVKFSYPLSGSIRRLLPPRM